MMEECHQSAHETVWQHCQSVAKTYFSILETPEKFQLPPIIKDNWNRLTQNQADPAIVREYLTWHDCGKPACVSLVDGRISFPNHAEVSENLFRKAGGNPESAKFIGLDMVFHLVKPSQVAADLQSLKLTTIETMTLLLTAWAALFSNAEMFGGTNSESFKIKYSQLTARSKKVL